MKNQLIIAAAFLALAACGKKTEEAAPAAAEEAEAPAAEEAATPVDPATSEPSSPLSDPAAQPIAGDPDSAWVELMGAWAQTGLCDDDTERWIIEAEQFSLYEMHCPIEKLELLQNGVKATSNCIAEGYDDGETDVFYFLRQGDGSLTIAMENGGMTNTGLFLCEGEETEL
jgi:hypothetical protein